MLTCRELVDLVTDYLEGVLPESDRERFESHLAACVLCQRYLDQMRQSIATVGRLSEAQIDPRAQHELLRAFRNWKKPAG